MQRHSNLQNYSDLCWHTLTILWRCIFFFFFFSFFLFFLQPFHSTGYISRNVCPQHGTEKLDQIPTYWATWLCMMQFRASWSLSAYIRWCDTTSWRKEAGARPISPQPLTLSRKTPPLLGGDARFFQLRLVGAVETTIWCSIHERADRKKWDWRRQ